MKYFLMALRRTSDFDGRSRRKEYWMYMLFYYLIIILLGFIEGYFNLFPESEDSIFGLIFQIVFLVPTLAVTVRRLHDTGKSGWFILIPIYNFILTLLEGDRGVNRYGDDPKADNDIEDKVEEFGKELLT